MRCRLLIIGLLFVLMTCSCGGREETLLGEGSYHVGAGASRLFRLPDGSKLLLSPKTSIFIAKGFGRENRDMELDGEALFEVVAGPLHLHTRDLSVDVLWAARFRVDAYRNKAGEEVDLLAGRLQVAKSYHSDTDSASEVLEAGEMVMINRDIDLMEKEKLSADELNKVKAKGGF
jgi:transmembrane sensor